MTLTPNRILQKGDEYLEKGQWKPVPKPDWGMLVQFVKYEQVRRPSEDLAKASNTKAGQSTTAPKATAKAEAKPVPASGVSPAGGESLAEEVIHGISTKETIAADKKKHLPMPSPVARLLPKTGTGILKLPFPAGSPNTIWIGRNGTFNARGIDFRVVEQLDEKDNTIQIRPAGKRGLAKNALIEFPASVIPQIVDWLLRMQSTSK